MTDESDPTEMEKENTLAVDRAREALAGFRSVEDLEKGLLVEDKTTVADDAEKS